MSKPVPITAIRGFRDVLPEEMRGWQTLENTARALFDRYGFAEIELPVLERTELFARAVGETTDIVEKEMFSFRDRDKDETSVSLRPEATAGVVRAYLENGLVHRDRQVRLFYVGPMFRRERPQRGRYRQFYQIGAEALGRHDPLADAEMLVLLWRYLEQVETRAARLELNSLGDAVCRPAYRERLRAFAEAHRDGLCAECHRRLERNPLRILDCKVAGCRAVVERAPLMRDSLCAPCAEHFATVRALLDQERVPYTWAPRLVRGLDYYVRTAFEVLSDAEGLGAQNAIGGGGRYDGLVSLLGGPDVPGLGFALGLDRLALAADPIAAETAGPVAVILPLEERAVGPALRLATRLRDEGLAIGVEPAGRSLKALLGVANKRQARLAVILGPDELAVGRATVRNLVSSADRPQALDLDAPGDELARWMRAEAAA